MKQKLTNNNVKNEEKREIVKRKLKRKTKNLKVER